MAVIGIMSAMHEELAAVLGAMPDEQRVQVAGRDFWVGHWQGQSVVAVLSRIGKVAAATTATLLAERFGAGAMVFTGVAGGLGTGVRVGDVVVADAFLQHDLDVSPLFPRYEVPAYGRARFAVNPGLGQALAEAAQDALTAHWPGAQLHRGLVASGDRFVCGADESRHLQARLRHDGHEALAVEMEGAAVAQVCADHGLPFAAMRTISDRADDDAHQDFTHFVKTVASRYAELIVRRLLQRWQRAG